jgi:hypothetical protein
MGSKLGLILALAGGLLYILVGVTTSVSASALDAISSLIINNIPMYSSYIIPIVKWFTGLGGVGVILGGLIVFFSSGQIHEYGGYIIILSALGGILSYASILYTAQQAGVFSQSVTLITGFLVNLGPGLLASALSVLAYIKRQ